MFKLFGKKKDQQPDPQTEPSQKGPQVLQSQHPLASALAAQFDGGRIEALPDSPLAGLAAQLDR